MTDWCGFYKLSDDVEFIVNDGKDPNYKFEYDFEYLINRLSSHTF